MSKFNSKEAYVLKKKIFKQHFCIRIDFFPIIFYRLDATRESLEQSFKKPSIIQFIDINRI